MGLRDHVICDSDLHVMEPPDLWERYIEPAYAHAALGACRRSRDMRAKVKNNVMLRLGSVRPMRIDDRKTGWRQEHDNVYAAGSAGGTRSRRSMPWTPKASTWRCCSRRAACSCSGSTRSTRWAPTDSSPATPPRSPVRTTTG